MVLRMGYGGQELLKAALGLMTLLAYFVAFAFCGEAF